METVRKPAEDPSARKQEISQEPLLFFPDPSDFQWASLSAPRTAYLILNKYHRNRSKPEPMKFTALFTVLWLSTMVPAVAGSPQSPEPDGPGSFSVPDRGGQSTTSSGTGETLRVGYGRIRADAGSGTPSGIAIFQFRDSDGVLVSEASVPATEPMRDGRIFAEVNGRGQYRPGDRQSERRAGNHRLLFHRHQRHLFRGRQLRTWCEPADCEIPGSGAIQRWPLRIGNLYVYLIAAGRCRRPPGIHQRSRLSF